MKSGRKRRAMNVAGVVLWVTLIGAAFTFVNVVGIFSTQLNSPSVTGNGSTDAVLLAEGCKLTVTDIPYNCPGNTNAPADALSTIYTFGNFMWSFVSAVPAMLAGILVPGTLANQWFGSGIGVVVNAGMVMLFVFWGWSVVGNRHPDFTPE